jgi:hypothetical protein
MTITAAAQPKPIVSPNPGLRFTNESGNLTNNGRIALQQMHDFIVSISRIIPAEATTTSNTITLTLLDSQPQVNQYGIFDTYTFIADATTTGNVSALVVTAQGTLSTLNVYKTNGSARAASGDVAQNLQYFMTYVDALNSGAGGFVLR